MRNMRFMAEKMRKTRKVKNHRDVMLALSLGDAYDHGVARGVVRYAAEHGWRLHGWGWMFRPLRRLGSWRGDGAIARITGTADARRLAAVGVPVVDVAGAVSENNVHAVTNDDRTTGRHAGEALARSGFRHAAFVGVTGVQWSQERYIGFSACFADITVPALRRGLTWWHRQDTARTLVPWLRRLPHPVAVFASHDVAALRVIEACHDAGLAVPDAIAVLGVDDERIACELAVPTLSSIPPDCETIGYQAAALLDRAMHRPQMRRQVQRIPPLDPVWRASTATVVVQDPLVVRCLSLLADPLWLPRGVAALAQHLGVSRRTLELHVRAAVGESILTRWTRVRLEVARRRLRDGGSITAAAQAAGWSDARSLAASVRRHAGQTVAQWATPTH